MRFATEKALSDETAEQLRKAHRRVQGERAATRCQARREIRRRIRSVKSTSQITRAMEMVSAVKMRRAQEAVLASRPYAERMLACCGTWPRTSAAGRLHPLLQERPVEQAGVAR